MFLHLSVTLLTERGGVSQHAMAQGVSPGGVCLWIQGCTPLRQIMTISRSNLPQIVERYTICDAFVITDLL